MLDVEYMVQLLVTFGPISRSQGSFGSPTTPPPQVDLTRAS